MCHNVTIIPETGLCVFIPGTLLASSMQVALFTAVRVDSTSVRVGAKMGFFRVRK